MWEVITGSKLGIKARGKTVLTGIAYGDDGRPRKVKDPGQFTAGGTRLPFMPYHAAYKYLGKYTRADAIDDVAWAKLLPKFEAGLSRLRSLHKVSLKDFYVVSEAILNGLAGAACQTMYLTFEQCEIIEAKWRKVYGSLYRRVKSAPRARRSTRRAARRSMAGARFGLTCGLRASLLYLQPWLMRWATWATRSNAPRQGRASR